MGILSKKLTCEDNQGYTSTLLVSTACKKYVEWHAWSEVRLILSHFASNDTPSTARVINYAHM